MKSVPGIPCFGFENNLGVHADAHPRVTFPTVHSDSTCPLDYVYDSRISARMQIKFFNFPPKLIDNLASTHNVKVIVQINVCHLFQAVSGGVASLAIVTQQTQLNLFFEFLHAHYLCHNLNFVFVEMIIIQINALSPFVGCK